MSLGYTYHASMKEAQEHIRKVCAGEVCGTAQMPKNRKELVQLLRDWGGHADNG
jgi:hypothetical protein